MGCPDGYTLSAWLNIYENTGFIMSSGGYIRSQKRNGFSIGPNENATGGQPNFYTIEVSVGVSKFYLWVSSNNVIRRGEWFHLAFTWSFTGRLTVTSTEQCQRVWR